MGFPALVTLAGETLDLTVKAQLSYPYDRSDAVGGCGDQLKSHGIPANARLMQAPDSRTAFTFEFQDAAGNLAVVPEVSFSFFDIENGNVNEEI